MTDKDTTDRQALGEMDNDELANLVRNTAAFRAAASCAAFSDQAQELRDNDSLAFDRLVKETHAKQGTSVSKRATTRTIVNTFIDVVGEHAAMADEPADAAENAATEVVHDG